MQLIIARLLKSPPHINPAVALCQALETATLRTEEIIARQAEIRNAMKQGQAEVEAVKTALTALQQCAPTPARRVPRGF